MAPNEDNGNHFSDRESLVAAPKPAIERNKLFQELEYEPHPAQWEMHEDASRFKVACCGRRFGKSTWAVRDLWPYYFIPHSQHWIVGPTYELGEREFEVLESDVHKMGLSRACDISYSPKAGNMRVRFPWGAEVRVVSAEKPKSLLGKGLTSAIMSESGEHLEITWTKYIRPALSDKRGRANFPSTPKGFNWYYEYYMRGQKGVTDWASWRHPSWDNTHIYSGPDDPEFDEIRSNTSEQVFRQEYGAEFVAYEGQVYEEFDETIHVCDLSGIVGRYMGAWRNYWSIDFGYTNPFACLDIMVDTMDNVYVWREYYVSGIPTMQHADALRDRDNPPGFHVNAIFADPAGADQVATIQLKLGAVFAQKVSWIEGVEYLRNMFRKREGGAGRIYIDRSCENLIRELHMLHYVENRKPGQQNSKEMQHTVHDHACDALRYFVNNYFVLGAGRGLQSIMQEAYGDTAETFFQHDNFFTREIPA